MKDGKKAKSQKAPGKKSSKAASPQKAARTPAPRAAVERGSEIHFSNPLVAAAFKRAVKKYPAALKRLSD